MKNRNIPFGYRFDGGIAVIDSTERKTFERNQQGKYSSKYALNELLVCGECGTPYR